MNYTTVAASKPGASVPKIDKRTADSKIFMIDCQPLLCDKELIFGQVLNNTTPLIISEVKTSQGKYIKFRVSGGPTDVPYTDYLIIFTVNTIMQNMLTVPVSIRVYSN